MVLTFIILNILAIPSGYAYRWHLELYDKGDIGCGFYSKRVQIGIAVDNTGFSSRENVQEALVKYGKEIEEAVQALHKDTEFALTTHSSYDDKAWGARHNLPEGCYMRSVNFTTNLTEITEAVKRLEYTSSATLTYNDYSLTAVAFTICDNTVGWIREDIDKDGRNVNRMILLFLHKLSYFELKNPGNRTQFRGDGTDTCSGSLPATRKQVGEILKKHGVMIIGVYEYTDAKIYRQYVDFFQEYRIPHIWKQFRGKYGIGEYIVEFVPGAVRQFLQCYHADPPAYNTLGL